MAGNKGAALVFLLAALLLFSVLGAGLLSITLAEISMGRHLAEADQAFFSAEAGVERAVASLPRCPVEFLAYTGKHIKKEGLPAFAVEISPWQGEEAARLILSEGTYRGKKRKLKAVARLRVFGENTLVSTGLVSLNGVEAAGSVLAGEVVFAGGENTVRGRLATVRGTAVVGSASCNVLGGECQVAEIPAFMPDFDFFAEVARAAPDRWHVLEGKAPGEAYGLAELAGATKDLVFVPGDLVIDGEWQFTGLVVVMGKVTILGKGVGKTALIAAGDVELASREREGGALLGGWLVLSGRGISARGGSTAPFVLEGVLAAREGIDLENISLRRGAEAPPGALREFPRGVFAPFATIGLEYLEISPRR